MHRLHDRIVVAVARLSQRQARATLAALQVAIAGCSNWYANGALRGEAALRALADAHGFEVHAVRREVLRHEQQKPIDGLLLRLSRR